MRLQCLDLILNIYQRIHYILKSWNISGFLSRYHIDKEIFELSVGSHLFRYLHEAVKYTSYLVRCRNLELDINSFVDNSVTDRLTVFNDIIATAIKIIATGPPMKRSIFLIKLLFIIFHSTLTFA